MKMVAEEFNNIRKHKILTATIIAIMIIPFLYSLFFLKSVWDPYGNTKYLPVAVVNNDKPVKYQGKTFKVGEDLEKELRENKDLGWHFVNAKEAKYGLSHKKYYMVITIPKNFSKNATTVLDKHPKKMQLTYNTNDALNYIGKVIGEEGAKQVNSSVRDSVSEAYATTMFDTVKKVGKGFNKAAKGATQLSDGAYTLSDGLKVYTAGVDQVNDGVIQLKNGVAPLSAGVLKLTTGASVLADGSNQLASGIKQYTDGAGQLNAGIQKLNGSVNGKNGLSSGVSALVKGGNDLNNAFNGKVVVGNTTTNLVQSANALAENSEKINQAIAKMNKEVASIKVPNKADIDGLIAAKKELNSINLSDLTAASGQITNMSKKLDAVQGQANSFGVILNQNLTAIGTDSGTAAQEVAAVLQANQDKLSDTDKAKLQDAINKNQDVVAKTTAIGTAAKQFNSQMQELVNELGPAKEQMTNLMKEADKLSSNLATLKNAPINTDSLGKLSKLPELQARVGELSANYSNFNSGIQAYSGKIKAAATGSAQLSAGLNELGSQTPALTSGVSQLASGGSKLAASSGELNSGASQVSSGAGQLAGGLGQMNAQVPTLTNGVNQLASGTQQLAANSGQLIDGANKISEGNGTLAKSLSAGAKEVNSQNLNSANANMFAAPTTLKHKNYSYVPNYGYALAPYMLSVALYVGALVFNLVYPIRRLSTPDGSATEWFFSKVSIGAVVAVGNAIVEVGLMMLAGLHPDHPFATFMNAISFSLAAMFIIMVLAMLFSNPGRFIGMIFLVIQLGACGGSFPIQITKGMNGFFQAINPYLPMTYSVYGFRESLSSGLGSSQMTISLTVQLIFIVASLLLLWISMSYLRTSGKVSYSEEPTSIED
ncbi:YhgE/Pip domain-containing protein [Ligilactobacillus salivarius]|uniref:YhgE/Pip domain-containing protein n=1 Tax=Ligilactobacillus salivarius TaxID=1624 RepID=UPI00117BDABA|nr:YhgE/Pip domain-containing protein [Ligilactobacillus salivarius]